MPIYLNESGVNKEVTALHASIGGVNTEIAEIVVNAEGVNKQVFNKGGGKVSATLGTGDISRQGFVFQVSDNTSAWTTWGSTITVDDGSTIYIRAKSSSNQSAIKTLVFMLLGVEITVTIPKFNTSYQIIQGVINLSTPDKTYYLKSIT